MSKYFKNFILCGDIDYFCLLCEEAFEGTDEVEKHIRWEQHRKRIKSVERVPKFANDGIVKILDHYYCELCNFITPSFSNLKIHVGEESHNTGITNTDEPKKDNNITIKRCEYDILVGDMSINKKDWHSIVDNQCMLCNVSVTRFNEHKETANHMIKLIQSKINIEDGKWIFRKMLGDTQYCFKCKKTVLDKDLSDHCKSDDHLGGNTKTNIERLFETNYLKYTATCRVCKKTMSCRMTVMSDHRDDHVKNNEWEILEHEQNEKLFVDVEDRGKARAELKKYGKDNYIKLNEGGRKGYCTVCFTSVSPHINNFREHANGQRHKAHLEIRGLIKKSKTVEIPKYKTKLTKQLFAEDNLFYVHNVDKYFVMGVGAIDLLNFFMMDLPDVYCGKFICYLCDGNGTYPYSYLSHMLSHDHKANMAKTPIVKIEGEFVREIKPGLYHCGFCNTPFAGWVQLQKHLNLINHKFARMESLKVVQDYVESHTRSVHHCNCTKCNYMQNDLCC